MGTEKPEDPKARIAAVFSRTSATYDTVIPMFAHFGQRIVTLTGVAPDERILDIATGRGACLFPAAERVGAGGHVTGIDLAEGMVRETAAEAARRNLGNVDIRLMDAERLEFGDAQFDRALCAFGIMFLPDPRRALAEAVRVVGPGGVVAVATWVGAGERWEFVAPLAEKLAGAPGRPLEGPWETASGLEGLLREAGCGHVAVMEETEQFAFAGPEVWWEWVWTQGQRFYLERMSDANRAEFKRIAFERLRDMERAGELRLDQRMRLALARV